MFTAFYPEIKPSRREKVPGQLEGKVVRVQIGFTGTQKGMTFAQRRAARDVLWTLIFPNQATSFLHHGDCVGADQHMHAIAYACATNVHLHPPGIDAKRAFCKLHSRDECENPKPYLERNRDIVDATSALIAAPAEATEQLRSGTWSTVRYARKLGRPIYLVLPDGTVDRSGGTSG